MPTPRVSATQIAFNATGQQFRQTTSLADLGGVVTETPNLSDEIDWRIPAGCMSSRRYTRELYDRPKANLSAAPEGPGGAIRGSRGSPIWIRDIDSP